MPSSHDWVRSFADASLWSPPPNALCVFADASTEPRGLLPVWSNCRTAAPQSCISIRTLPEDTVPTSEYLNEVDLVTISGTERVSLRDTSRLAERLLQQSATVIDISGLPHHVWASVLRAYVDCRAPCDLTMFYSEPKTYKVHKAPASLSSYDLSTRLLGVHPIPGFAVLADRRADSRETLFVPLLGFEGARPRYLFTQLEPTSTVPVIGVPGFKLEFPLVAAACNLEFLQESNAIGLERFAPADCPFSLYQELSEIRRDHAKYNMLVAPIGTKPHALGAFLFALMKRDRVEIVYDHPLRRVGRTEGTGPVHTYDVSGFVRSEAARHAKQ